MATSCFFNHLKKQQQKLELTTNKCENVYSPWKKPGKKVLTCCLHFVPIAVARHSHICSDNCDNLEFESTNRADSAGGSSPNDGLIGAEDVIIFFTFSRASLRTC